MARRIDPDRVPRLTTPMEDALRVKTARSGRFVDDARQVLPAGVAGKGGIMFFEQEIVDYRSYAEHFHAGLNYLAWRYHMNGGVYMTPGADEQWTRSIAHIDEGLDRYAAVLEEFARDLTA